MLGKRALLLHSGGYKVSVGTTDILQSSLLGRTSRGKKFANFSAKFATIFFVIIAFTGILASSFLNSSTTKAHADVLGVDELISNLCSAAPTGYGSDDLGFMVPSNSGKDHKNAYEKYGMYGTTYTVWNGFNTDPETLTGEGKKESRPLILLAGGDGDKANIHQFKEWGDATKQSGIFNFEESCASLNIGRAMPTSVANGLLGFGKFATWLSGAAYEASATVNKSIYEYMKKPVEIIVSKLKSDLYMEYLAPMIMLGALWIGWVGLKRRQSTQAGAGVIWMVGAIAGAVLLMTQPMMIPDMLNKVVTGISSTAMSSITATTNSSSTKNTTGLCATTGAKKADRAVRNVQCNLWYSFVYTPWVMGEFGQNPEELAASEKSSPNGFLNLQKTNGGNDVWKPVVGSVDAGKGHTIVALNKRNQDGTDSTSKLSLQKVQVNGKNVVDSEQTWALYFLDHKVNWNKGTEADKVNQMREQYQATFNQLASKDYNSTFRGDNGTGRISVASMALFSAVAAAIMVIIISITIIIMDLTIILLAVGSPIFFLAGIHPGAGRGIAMGWLSHLLNVALKRIALSLFLAVMIAVLGLMMLMSSGNENMSWVISMVIILAVSIIGIVYQKEVQGLFSRFHFNGAEALNSFQNPGQRVGQVGRKVGRGVRQTTRMAGGAGRMAKSVVPAKSSGAGKQDQGGAGSTPSRRAQIAENARQEALAQHGIGGAGSDPSANRTPLDDGPTPRPIDPDSQHDPELGSGTGGSPDGNRTPLDDGPTPRPIDPDSQHDPELGSGTGGSPDGNRTPLDDGPTPRPIDPGSESKDNPNYYRNELKRRKDEARQNKNPGIIGRTYTAASQRVIESRKAGREKREENRLEATRRRMTNDNLRQGIHHNATREEAQKVIAENKRKKQERADKIRENALKYSGVSTARSVARAHQETGSKFVEMTKNFDTDYLGSRVANTGQKLKKKVSDRKEFREEQKARKTVIRQDIRHSVKNALDKDTEERKKELKRRKEEYQLTPRKLRKEIPKPTRRSVK